MTHEENSDNGMQVTETDFDKSAEETESPSGISGISAADQTDDGTEAPIDEKYDTIERNGNIMTKDKVYIRGKMDHDLFMFYQAEPFLSGICASITKLIDEKQPTAYVGVRKNGRSHEVVMGLNPEFFDSMNVNQKHGVLKHELYHLIFQHIFTRAIGEHSLSMLWNWATDMAINSIIGPDNLPKMVICPGVHPIDPKTGKPVEGKYAEFIAKAPPLMASDWYFAELRRIQDEEGDSDLQLAIGSGIGTMDDHGQWADLPSEVQEQIKDKVNGLIEKGVIKAQKTNQWGSVPQEMREQIIAMLSREIDWRSIVRNFWGRIRTMKRNSTIRKINKKMPYIFPGVRRPTVASFACFIDQSGSVCDEDIQMFFGELGSFSKETNLDVFHFDTEIDEKSHSVWKKGAPNPPAHRTRCGGTDFNAVANFVNRPENRGRWSGVVILTDGYAPTMGAIQGAKVLWVITESGSSDACRPGDLVAHMKKDKAFKKI